MEQIGFHQMNFHEIWYLSIFWKPVEKIQGSLKSDKNDGYFTCRPIYINDRTSLVPRWILVRLRNVSDRSSRENQNTHLMFNNFSSPKSYHLWDNVEECSRFRKATDDSIIRCMRFACWINKVTEAHWEYVILLFRGCSGYANAPKCYVIRTLHVFL